MRRIDPTTKKADEIADAIRRAWWGLYWFRELRIGIGYAADANRYLDLWGISPAREKRYRRVAIEIKTSRNDFTRELRIPGKREWAVYHSNEFYFAAPPGVLTPDDMPYPCGLLEVDEAGTVVIAKPAAERDTDRPTWRFVAALARRLKADGAGLSAEGTE